MDRAILYDLIYALAALDGREAALFGNYAPFAREAFARSLAGSPLSEVWFELPLAGDPWFDLHVAFNHEGFDAAEGFDPSTCSVPEAFAWFAAQGPSARQLILSWDVSTKDVSVPAVHLLRYTPDTQLTCDFLEELGRQDAVAAYQTFENLLPTGWFACYAGVFPGRREPFLRVECIPTPKLQQAYAEDANLLKAHLQQVGLAEVSDTLLTRCQVLAAAPFRLEFQFNVTPDGLAGSTFAASARFALPPGEGTWAAFDPNGAAGKLIKQVEDWGLADERWHLLADTIFSKRIKAHGESWLIYCYPAFIKLRWRNGDPLDAKAYLMSGLSSAR